MKGFIPTLIILAACLFSLPASAQVNTLSPEVLDSLYSEVEILVGENIDDQGNVISLGWDLYTKVTKERRTDYCPVNIIRVFLL